MKALRLLIVFFAMACLKAGATNYATEFQFPVGSHNFQTWRESNGFGNSWASYYGHLGSDYVISNAARKPVYAVANGSVHKVYNGGPTWRGVVIVRHELPNNQSFDFTGTVLDANIGQNPTNLNIIYSLYGHIFDIQVAEGDSVSKGSILGYLCDTCIDHPNDCSEEEVSWIPHLHFEIKNQYAIDNSSYGGVGHGYSGQHLNAPHHYNPSRFLENNLQFDPDQPFIDVSSYYWAYEFIRELKLRGIMNGMNGYFYPENPISRGEVCTMIVRARNLPWNPSYSNPFVDLPTGHSHYQAVLICYHLGFVSGIGNRFYPDNHVLRRDAAKMLCRGFELSTYQVMTRPWSDYMPEDDNFEYAYALKKRGVLGGYPDGRFGPNNNLTRAEAAKVFSNVLGLN